MKGKISVLIPIPRREYRKYGNRTILLPSSFKSVQLRVTSLEFPNLHFQLGKQLVGTEGGQVFSSEAHFFSKDFFSVPGQFPRCASKCGSALLLYLRPFVLTFCPTGRWREHNLLIYQKLFSGQFFVVFPSCCAHSVRPCGSIYPFESRR